MQRYSAQRRRFPVGMKSVALVLMAASAFLAEPASAASQKSALARCAYNCQRMRTECIRSSGVLCDGFYDDCMMQVRTLGLNARICGGTPQEWQRRE
jgi:hypothetical protein